MKILLSEKWRYEMKALFCIEAIGIIFCTISFVKDVEVMLFFALFILITMTIVEIIGFFSCYRFFTYTIDKKDSYESFLFKRSLCIIDKSRPIYYVTFWGVEGTFSKREYIVLANEPFEYQNNCPLRIFPWDKKPLLVSYNVKKQIVMPYNEVTKSILETDKWYSLE